MGVEINQAEAFTALVKVTCGAGKGSNRNRVIASQNDRKFIRLKDFMNSRLQLFAGCVNLRQVFQLLVEARKRSRTLRMQIAKVIDVISDGRDSLPESKKR